MTNKQKKNNKSRFKRKKLKKYEDTIIDGASKLELLRNSCDVHLVCAGAFLCDLREALSVCLAAHSKEVILETLTYEIYVSTYGDRACDTELMLRYKLKTLVLLNQIEPISWGLAHSGSR